MGNDGQFHYMQIPEHQAVRTLEGFQRIDIGARCGKDHPTPLYRQVAFANRRIELSRRPVVNCQMQCIHLHTTIRIQMRKQVIAILGIDRIMPLITLYSCGRYALMNGIVDGQIQNHQAVTTVRIQIELRYDSRGIVGHPVPSVPFACRDIYRRGVQRIDEHIVRFVVGTADWTGNRNGVFRGLQRCHRNRNCRVASTPDVGRLVCESTHRTDMTT